jgi:hypothetical protein
MKNKIPKTELEIELFCDKIILLEANRKLSMHLQALQEVLKEKPKEGYHANF